MQRFSATLSLLVLLASAFEIGRLVEGAKATKPTQTTPRRMEKLQAAATDISSAATTCKNILKKKPNAPSGTYTVTTRSGDFISIYCEMGLNGGGYTFLSSMSLMSLTDEELSTMFTDRTTFLLRVRKTNGTQPYAVLSQLSPEYAHIPLKLSLNSYAGFNQPVNSNRGTLEPPFLFFGFIPNANNSIKGRTGVTANGNSITYENCQEYYNSQFTLYTNFKEAQPTTENNYNVSKFCNRLFASLLPNPSGRVMPSEFFFFGETVWGGCGCYVQTNQLADITGFSIGFR